MPRCSRRRSTSRRSWPCRATRAQATSDGGIYEATRSRFHIYLDSKDGEFTRTRARVCVGFPEHPSIVRPTRVETRSKESTRILNRRLPLRDRVERQSLGRVEWLLWTSVEFKYLWQRSTRVVASDRASSESSLSLSLDKSLVVKCSNVGLATYCRPEAIVREIGLLARMVDVARSRR